MSAAAVDATTLPSHGLYLGGREVPALRGETFTSHDPATGEPIAVLASATREDVDRAVKESAAVFPGWAATIPSQRGRLMMRIAEAIREQREELARWESLDNGKPLWLALSEVDSSARYFEFYAGLADKLGGETIPLGPGFVSYTRREPYGPIAEILPWNAPLNQAARGLAPALVTGNTAVVKPAELTSITCLMLARLASEAGLPPGVLNVVTGSGATVGEALVSHPAIRKVGFTGSVATGRRIAHLAADRLIPASLELGGKSANIVFADADLDSAAPSAFNAFTLNSGQICSAGTRLLVEDFVHDELVARLVEMSRDATVGHGIDNPNLGPLTSKQQFETVQGYLELARSEGATIVPDYADWVPEPGYFVRPTLLVDVDNRMRVAREEIFGPVLSVIRFRGEEEAVRLANDSPFGLVAGVWTQDVGRAHRVAAQLEAGQVFVNQYFAGGEETPFGGYKDSGYGRVKGIEAVYHCTHVKAVTVKL